MKTCETHRLDCTVQVGRKKPPICPKCAEETQARLKRLMEKPL